METISPSVQAEKLLREINGETWKQKHLLETVSPDQIPKLLSQLQQIQMAVLKITFDLQGNAAEKKKSL